MKANHLIDIKMLPTMRGYEIAYQQYIPKNPSTERIGILFLHGHGSDMFGSKAEAIMEWSIQNKIEFTRFDLYGHGQSGGDIMSATIGQWIEDSCDIFDKIINKKQILIGSSLGGWLMLSLCKYRLEKIDSLIGIAAAPDFTKSLIWETLNKSQKNEFRKQGVLTIPNPYDKTNVKYPFQLIQEAKKHLILENNIEFYGRAILHHGLLDEEVPWQTSLKIAEKLCSNNVKIQLDKTANHRYSEPEQINSLINSLEELTS